ncbi:E3 ubiquitin-protein ligase MBR2-like [Olea europaea var. sylvestris]|uniref:E3 ubiquitin-protein ligase MBR2-like n=1 Tax=Olea europaea var. sylvestris TaxID=158386 RepID=UPI000C1D8049|nr:E3 ubiquitin-protein ligase MBR2-like [Olea europaea var. sylvestris]
MSASVADTSKMAEHTKCRKPRSQNHLPTSSTKIKNFTTATFRGLGCTAYSKVSDPAVIRTSANWNANKVKNKKITNNNSKLHTNNSTAAVTVTSNVKNNNGQSSNSSSSNCVGLPDVWCGPGISLTGDAASENCVVSRRPAVSARNKADGVHRIIHSPREHSSYNMRRMVTSEDIPFRNPGIALGMQRSRADFSGSRYHHHLRHEFRDGFAEIVMLQSSLLMEGRSEQPDEYRGWRLDVDNMSYEELLELGDRIGHVSTGLRENEISCCLRRTNVSMLNNLSSNFPTETERKCSICQEEYETDDETGKLNCGHFYHIQCIKQWLVQKNICPICKKSAMPQTKTT